MMEVDPLFPPCDETSHVFVPGHAQPALGSCQCGDLSWQAHVENTTIMDRLPLIPSDAGHGLRYYRVLKRWLAAEPQLANTLRIPVLTAEGVGAINLVRAYAGADFAVGKQYGAGQFTISPGGALDIAGNAMVTGVDTLTEGIRVHLRWDVPVGGMRRFTYDDALALVGQGGRAGEPAFPRPLFEVNSSRFPYDWKFHVDPADKATPQEQFRREYMQELIDFEESPEDSLRHSPMRDAIDRIFQVYRIDESKPIFPHPPTDRSDPVVYPGIIVGEVAQNGHPMATLESMQRIAALGNAMPNGINAYRPGLDVFGPGQRIGQLTNLRVDADKLLADLTLRKGAAAELVSYVDQVVLDTETAMPRRCCGSMAVETVSANRASGDLFGISKVVYWQIAMPEPTVRAGNPIFDRPRYAGYVDPKSGEPVRAFDAFRGVTIAEIAPIIAEGLAAGDGSESLAKRIVERLKGRVIS